MSLNELNTCPLCPKRGQVWRRRKSCPWCAEWLRPHVPMSFLRRGHGGRVTGCLLVVSTGVSTAGPRGTCTSGCSLWPGEEIPGHLQLPFISRGVRPEPSEKAAGGLCPARCKHQKTETNVSQPGSAQLCPFAALNMRVQIDLVPAPPHPSHPFSGKTDSFMCRYHVVICAALPVAIVFQERLLPDRRDG